MASAHQRFRFGDVTIRSDFDTGNCAHAEQRGPEEFHVWAAADRGGTTWRSWFHFAVSGFPRGSTVTFFIHGMNKQSALFRHDHRPPYCAVPSRGVWRRGQQPVHFEADPEPVPAETGSGGGWRLRMRHRFEATGDEVFFAFCYPFAWREVLTQLEELEGVLGNDARVRTRARARHAARGGGDGDDGDDDDGVGDEDAEKEEDGEERVMAAMAAAMATATGAGKHMAPGGDDALAPHDAPPRAHPPLLGPQEAARARARIYFARECLCRSVEGRRIDLLTITAPLSGSRASAAADGAVAAADAPLAAALAAADREDIPAAAAPGAFPDVRTGHARRPLDFPGRPVAFISARVHPGETPASHVLDGLLRALLRPDDPRAVLLRNHFVFLIVPVINPDGVAMGHYRGDALGANLNRYYHDPNPVTHPQVHAIRALCAQYAAQGRLAFYLDLHAHVSKRGCFFYGNHLDSARDQIENWLYVYAASLHCPHIELNGCVFSASNMASKDKRDASGTSKAGLAVGGARLPVGPTRMFGPEPVAAHEQV